jgi:acetoacetyl-CoA reductase/3-oxoacyl-[acyl-carrier protein] reductase
MIIIVGASGGIGYFIYNQYKSKNIEAVGTYCSNNHDKELYQLDITDSYKVHDFALQFSNIKEITILNCFGINYNIFFHKSDIDMWKNVIDVNLMGCYNVIRAFIPLMREQQYGRIINFGSIVAQVPTCGVSAYATSKAALWGLSKSIAAENASKNITINTINLGYANVGMGINDVPSMLKETILNKLPSKLFCAPEDIFNTVEYIRNTAYINGATIDINGALI